MNDPNNILELQLHIAAQQRKIDSLMDSNQHLQTAHAAAYDRWIQAQKITEKSVLIMFAACALSLMSVGVTVFCYF